MNAMRLLLATILFIVGLASASAQTCLTNIPATTPTSEFISQTTNSVLHRRTGLVWMRCAIGQTWATGGCVGEAEPMTWQQALQLAHGYEVDGVGGWRVPNIKELSTITERQCVRPSVNADVFAGTPSDDFWSSTPAVTDPQRAWVVAFFNSSNSIKDKQRFVYVRLVRSYSPD